jgi:anion-transporting  ArsA/GET3 family ATPase
VVVLDAPATGHGLALLRAPLVVSQVIEAGPFGRLARDIATFSGDPEQCGVLVVTTAEEMPVQEALELVAALDHELGRAPEGIVANALYPALDDADRELAERDPSIALWRDRRRVAERELARLETSVEVPIVRLPLLATHRGPQLVAALAAAWSQAEGGS